MPTRYALALAAAFVLAAAPHAQIADSTKTDGDSAAEEQPIIRQAPRPRPVGRPRPPRTADRPGAHRLSGPRFGFTYLSAETVEKINDQFGNLSGNCDRNPQTGECRREELVSTSFPVVTQFGWQFERQMAQASNGLAIITETVGLIGGLERGIFLPSASLIVGVRTPGGLELGLGPNLSATGAAYAITAGFANPVGDINVPINLAAVLGRDGPRVSLLVGLTFSDGRY